MRVAGCDIPPTGEVRQGGRSLPTSSARHRQSLSCSTRNGRAPRDLPGERVRRTDGPLLCVLSGLALAALQGADLAARSKGRPDAPITVYEMSDFECPYCREFALETLPVHDLLFQRQPQWAVQADPAAYLTALADSGGTNPARLAACLASAASERAVAADLAAAARSGARSTPT